MNIAIFVIRLIQLSNNSTLAMAKLHFPTSSNTVKVTMRLEDNTKATLSLSKDHERKASELTGAFFCANSKFAADRVYSKTSCIHGQSTAQRLGDMLLFLNRIPNSNRVN